MRRFPIRRDCENIIFRFHAPARPIALVAIFTPTSAPLRERVGPYNLHQKCQMYRLSQNAGKATACGLEMRRKDTGTKVILSLHETNRRARAEVALIPIICLYSTHGYKSCLRKHP